MRCLFAVLLVIAALLSASVVDAGRHPHHPSSGSGHGHPESCLAQLSHYPKKQVKAFCVRYLNGRMPASQSTVTVSASTATIVVTPPISTVVETSVQPTTTTSVTTAITTTTTTVSTTTTSLINRRRRDQAEQTMEVRSKHRKSIESALKHYTSQDITNACFLFLYGRLDDDTTTTTTLAPVSTTSTAAATQSTVTTTTTATILATTTTSTTTVTTSSAVATTSVVVNHVVASGFDECTNGQNTPSAQCPWTFSGAARVSDSNPHSAPYNAFLDGSSPNFVQQVLNALVVGQQYILTYWDRSPSSGGSTVVEARVDGNLVGFDFAGAAYAQQTYTFTPTATQATLQLRTNPTESIQIYLDDVVVRRGGV